MSLQRDGAQPPTLHAHAHARTSTSLVLSCAARNTHPRWSVRPHTTEEGLRGIRRVHRSYLEAGADIICTHSYNLCAACAARVVGAAAL